MRICPWFSTLSVSGKTPCCQVLQQMARCTKFVLFKKKVSSSSEMLNNYSLFGGQLLWEIKREGFIFLQLSLNLKEH